MWISEIVWAYLRSKISALDNDILAEDDTREDNVNSPIYLWPLVL